MGGTFTYRLYTWTGTLVFARLSEENCVQVAGEAQPGGSAQLPPADVVDPYWIRYVQYACPCLSVRLRLLHIYSCRTVQIR